MPAIRVAPSLLSADFARLGEELDELASAGADLVHVDVMDGRFVPNLTIGPPVIESLRRRSRLPFDVHLMIERPELSLADYRNAGADWISVHAEAVVHLDRTLHRIRELGAMPGVALNPGTSLAVLDEVLPLCHHVLLMSVNPGFGGQAYIQACTGKARRLAALARERSPATVLEMDGGLGPATVRDPVLAGVSVVVAGSAVFGRPDRAAAIRALREACA